MAETAFVTRIRKLAEQAGFRVLSGDEDYVLAMFQYPGGRTQQVLLHPVGTVQGYPIVEIVSAAKEISEDLSAPLANRLLRENGEHSIGYWGIIAGPEGKALIGMHHNMMLDTLDPEELKVIVTALGVRADDLERELSGEDVF
ncbi:MAG: hypothetical protein HYU66_12480 [Armatimonadetes bacterium]|nr:hypothetical protein [Armatimonadota bacterium]